MSERPNLVVLAGPNGAGKTTSSRALLAEGLGILEFVNVDAIARGPRETSPIAYAEPTWERIRSFSDAR